MNWYTQQIFPWMMENSLASSKITALRRELLRDVQGSVLEIGIGGGLNLACYPAHIRKIAAVDVHAQLLQTAAARAVKSGMQVEFHRVSAERLPLEDERFDSVISTWSLCSIPDAAQALTEIRRVLKPGGKFYFLEHGLSPNAWVRFWQDRLTPIQKVVGAGCHLNRDIPALIQQAGLSIMDLKTFYIFELSRANSYSFLGHAQKGC